MTGKRHECVRPPHPRDDDQGIAPDHSRSLDPDDRLRAAAGPALPDRLRTSPRAGGRPQDQADFGDRYLECCRKTVEEETAFGFEGRARINADREVVVRDGRDWAIRGIPLAEITKAVVQVEFSPPAQVEVELATLGRADRTEAGT